MAIEINEAVARKVLEVVDHGLVRGLGRPIPGEMCVEAAVCYALGLPHGDFPYCVDSLLRAVKITLNDANWSSELARSAGLRRLAVAQLGSANVLDKKEFTRRIVDYTIRVSAPKALRSAANDIEYLVIVNAIKENGASRILRSDANKCEIEGTVSAIYDAAYNVGRLTKITFANQVTDIASQAAAHLDAANRPHSEHQLYYAIRFAVQASIYAANDSPLTAYAEAVVQILIEMKAPGCQWLALAEAA